jgi:hypothetical protein
MNKPIPNLRKLKHIEKAAQRDWARRHEIRAAGLRALGFYSEAFLYPWFNPVKTLMYMLGQVSAKRRASIFRVARAAMKRGLLVKIQSLGTPNWLDLKKMDSSVEFVSEFKHGDLRELVFSSPEQDKINKDIRDIKDLFIQKIQQYSFNDAEKVRFGVCEWIFSRQYQKDLQKYEK